MNVSIVGSGNVATHLAKAFYHAGFNILEICSHTEKNAKTLASQVDAGFLTKVGSLKAADLLIISVKDDAIADVLANLGSNHEMVVHTSGATPLAALVGSAKKYGVFYPLQTFSKQVEVKFEEVPLCVEASDLEGLEMLIKIGSKLSKSVSAVNSEDRKQLHLAAVFTCNFVNHLYACGKEILDEAGLSFELLGPLIQQTSAKILKAAPKDVQTGPAVRGDQSIMDNHLKLLENSSELKEMYIFLSKSIKKMHS